MQKNKPPAKHPLPADVPPAPDGDVPVSNNCTCEFVWEAELIARLEKPVQIKIGNKEFNGPQTLYKFSYRMKGECIDGAIHFSDPTKSAKPEDSTTGLKKPDNIPKGPWDEYLKLVPEIYSKFEGTAEIKAKNKTKQCAEIRFSAELTCKGHFKAEIPIEEGKKIEIELEFEEGESVPAEAVWTVCCCCSETAEGGCWSARRDLYSWEKKKFAGQSELLWTLNGSMGGCGKVTKVENIKTRKLY